MLTKVPNTVKITNCRRKKRLILAADEPQPKDQKEVLLRMSANNSYEAMMVFSVKNGEEGVPALIEKFKALIEQNGTLDSIDEWGKRKLAYAIDDEPEGFYALFNFSAAPEFPEEFYRIAGITDGVLRSLVVRK